MVSTEDCPQKLMEYVKTNPLILLQINGLIANAQYDRLIEFGLNTAKAVCGVSGSTEFHKFVEKNTVFIGLMKDLLKYVTPEEREQLKTWILGNQKIAISGFMMQKALVSFHS
ncbi:hypothetical protein FO519_001756 [Halicephalobus sp. NKZ332]|nr:hypothetical protein FO519_001756 [Halicephalobus sp. NKZ332]